MTHMPTGMLLTEKLLLIIFYTRPRWNSGVTTGSGWDRVSFPHSSPHSAVLCSGTQEDVDNTPAFWDCWEVLALPTQPPCVSRLGMAKIKEGGAADQRVIPYHIGFALQQKRTAWTEKRGYLLFILFPEETSMHSEALLSKKQLNIIYWWEIENKMHFFLCFHTTFACTLLNCFYFDLQVFSILFSVPTVLLRWVLGGTWYPAEVSSS